MDDLCCEAGQRVYDKKGCCVVSQKDRFLWYNFLFKQINHRGNWDWSCTAVRKITTFEQPDMLNPSCFWSVGNTSSFDIFDQCFCKVETRACESLRSFTKRLGGLVATTLPGTSRSRNPALGQVLNLSGNSFSKLGLVTVNREHCRLHYTVLFISLFCETIHLLIKPFVHLLQQFNRLTGRQRFTNLRKFPSIRQRRQTKGRRTIGWCGHKE